MDAHNNPVRLPAHSACGAADATPNAVTAYVTGRHGMRSLTTYGRIWSGYA